MSREWKTSEINYLKRYSSSKRIAELAQRFDTDGATIRGKLAALGLESKEGPVATAAGDVLLASFEQGLKALYDGEWKKASELLSEVAEGSDLPELCARARQFLAVCRDQLERRDDEDEDPFTRAVFHKNRGEFAEVLSLCAAKPHAGDERFLYLKAAVHALEHREEEAVAALARAVELNPENRVHAFHDSDFADLRQNQEHAHLFGLD